MTDVLFDSRLNGPSRWTVEKKHCCAMLFSTTASMHRASVTTVRRDSRQKSTSVRPSWQSIVTVHQDG